MPRHFSLPLLRSFRLPAWRLSGRLAGGFGLVLALLLLTMAAGLLGMQRMSQQTREIVEVSGRRGDVAQAMMAAANDTAVALYGFLLVGDDEEDAKQQTALFEAALARYEQAAAALQPLIGDAPDASTAQLLKTLEEAGSPARTMARNVVRMAGMGGNASAAFNAMNPRVVIDEWRAAIVKLLAHEAEAAAASAAGAQASYETARAVLA